MFEGFGGGPVGVGYEVGDCDCAGAAFACCGGVSKNWWMGVRGPLQWRTAVAFGEEVRWVWIEERRGSMYSNGGG
jgi:hypothetical protein